MFGSTMRRNNGIHMLFFKKFRHKCKNNAPLCSAKSNIPTLSEVEIDEEKHSSYMNETRLDVD